MAVNGCPICLHKQRRIDELEEEIKGLRAKLHYQERQAQEGFFGSSTPSAKLPVKPNTEQKEKKPRGARPGHEGTGRRSHDEEAVDRTVDVEPESETCPECGALLEKKGWAERSVIDTARQKPEKITFRLAKRYCPHCRRNVTPQPPGVLPKSLYGRTGEASGDSPHPGHLSPKRASSVFLGGRQSRTGRKQSGRTRLAAFSDCQEGQFRLGNRCGSKGKKHLEHGGSNHQETGRERGGKNQGSLRPFGPQCESRPL